MTSERFVVGEERWATVDGHRMRYLAMGPEEPDGELPPVVLIHGLLASSFSWSETMPALAHRRRIYAIDQVGIGYSDRPEDPAFDYSFRGMADRLLGWMAAEGLSGADVVGTSHGGALAMTMCVLDRQHGSGLVGRQVLVAAANPFSRTGDLRLRFFNTAFGNWVIRTVGVGNVAAGSLGLRHMFYDPSLLTPEIQRGYTEPMQLPGTERYACGILRTWKADMAELEAALPRIAEHPTQLIWGEDDKVVPLASGRQLAACFPGAPLGIIPRAGHLAYQERPEAFNRLLLDFLGE